MWPVNEWVQDCRRRYRLDTAAILTTPWDDEPQDALAGHSINPCTLQQSQPQIQADEQARRRWCIHSARKPFSTVAGERGAHIGTRWFPTAADQDE
jgi:hypothetical protein